MNKLLLSTVLIFMVSALFSAEGKIELHYEGENGTLYVDGKKNIMLNKEKTLMMLEEGNHVLKVVEPINDECQKYVQKEIYVSSSGSLKVTLTLENKLEPTEGYRKILEEKDNIKFQRFHRTKCNIVSDRKQGLMWQDDEFASTTKRDLKGAKEYCQELEFSIFDDWRLPSYEELLSIVDYDRYKPAVVPLFKQTFSKQYWSSSADVSAPDYAWVIDFGDGKTSTTINSKKHHVRCVR